MAETEGRIVTDLLNSRNRRSRDREAYIGIAIPIRIDQDGRICSVGLNSDIAWAKLFANHLDNIAISRVGDKISVQFRGRAAKRVGANTAHQRIRALATANHIIANATINRISARATC